MLLQLSIVLALLTKQISSCPFAGTGDAAAKDMAHAEILGRRLSTAAAPSSCLTRAGPLNPSKGGICRVYSDLQDAFTNTIMPSLDTDLKKGDLFGKAVRLAFHDAAEVDVTQPTDMMGPDGCLSSDTGHNGLNTEDSLVYTVIEALWQAECDYISRADFWVLFAHFVIKNSEPTSYINLPFHYGRVDATSSCDSGSGRLPDSGRGMPAIEDTFVTAMGLTLDDGAALIGAHTLGHVHEENSGFTMAGDHTTPDGLVNGWDTTPHIFDNLFYRQLLTFNWHNILNPAQDRGQWKRNPTSQYAIMLNTDMALTYDLDVQDLTGTANQVCGPFGTSDSHFGCSAYKTVMPATCNAACKFANSNTYWLDHFSTSFTKMTNVGYGVPDNTDGATATGKLGTLTTIDFNTC